MKELFDPDMWFVVISQMNGQDYSSHSIHVFHVGKMRMKLCKGRITKARESYSTSMQVEALAVKFTQWEGELIQEKFKVKKLANFMKQDIERLMEEVQEARRIRFMHQPGKVCLDFRV
ncbi:Stomatal closure-related actin-binding protein, PH domain [Dillenia turbinata]|uniref:Stomatal closure-related actin-binding protein, PH domain n=1 Tax=Dillenia turbinata TaxID=194707 RepID=A0AAN8W9K7_9MAGN